MINIYHRDCMDAMAEMPDKAYDLAIVDPPYGIGDFSNKTENKKNGKCVTKGKFSNTIYWNDSIPCNEYFHELKRISKNRIIWGANYYNCFEKGSAIVWYKHTKHPNYSDCEIASYSQGVRVAFIDIEWYSLNRSETTIHPCQKPVKLYEWLLKNYAKQGDKILDTHGGSCSIAIACDNLEFDLDVYEVDAEYYEKAVQRLDDHRRQGKLFSGS